MLSYRLLKFDGNYSTLFKLDMDFCDRWFIFILLRLSQTSFLFIVQVDWPQPDANGKVNRDW